MKVQLYRQYAQQKMPHLFGWISGALLLFTFMVLVQSLVFFSKGRDLPHWTPLKTVVASQLVLSQKPFWQYPFMGVTVPPTIKPVVVAMPEPKIALKGIFYNQNQTLAQAILTVNDGAQQLLTVGENFGNGQKLIQINRDNVLLHDGNGQHIIYLPKA